tara:strand:- start:757 stop:1443 length:687 start_codon:yes stop_codon:yes gene_type:complete
MKDQDTENERKRVAYQKNRESQGEEYESKVDQSLRRAGTRTYSVRVKIETIIAVYDCLESFGGETKGRGIGSNLINVLTSCMESMQRDGLLPKHTNEEIVARYEEISGTKLTKPLLNVPLKLTQEVSTHDISAAVSEQIETNKEGKQTFPFNASLYETEDFSVGDVPDEIPLEDRVFQRKDDTLVKEVSMSEDEDAKSALLKTYKTLPESLWGSSSARSLYNANLKKE